jgi:hypothetical protein
VSHPEKEAELSRQVAQRPDLVAPAVRTFFRVAQVWNLQQDEQKRLLGLQSEANLSDLNSGCVAEVCGETIERISLVLGIFKAINSLVPDASRADEWMRASNNAPPFGGRSALDRMVDGEISDLYAVRWFLDAELG